MMPGPDPRLVKGGCTEIPGLTICSFAEGSGAGGLEISAKGMIVVVWSRIVLNIP